MVPREVLSTSGNISVQTAIHVKNKDKNGIKIIEDKNTVHQIAPVSCFFIIDLTKRIICIILRVSTVLVEMIQLIHEGAFREPNRIKKRREDLNGTVRF